MIVISVSLIYFSFIDAFTRIVSIENTTIDILASYVIFSTIILITKFSLDNSNKDSLWYKRCNMALYIITLILIIYVPFAFYLHLTAIPLTVAILLLILIWIISLTIPISKKFKKRRQGDISEDFSYQ